MQFDLSWRNQRWFTINRYKAPPPQPSVKSQAYLQLLEYAHSDHLASNNRRTPIPAHERISARTHGTHTRHTLKCRWRLKRIP